MTFLFYIQTILMTLSCIDVIVFVDILWYYPSVLMLWICFGSMLGFLIYQKGETVSKN